MPVQSLLNYKNLRAVLALLLVVALLCPPLVNVFIAKIHAAGNVTNYKVLINNSQASATGVTYTVQFTATENIGIQRLTVQLCTTATGTCTTPTGMTTTGASFVSSNVSGSSPSHTFTGNGTLRTDWTAATQTPLTVSYVVSGITNSSTANTTFYARLTTYSDAGSTIIDYGTAAFAILDTTSIAVTATVDPYLSFAVAGVASSATVNSATTNITTTATTIPLGTIVDGTPKIGAHDVTVSTNASSGYTVTASNSAILTDLSNAVLSSGSANIDKFSGTNASPTTWSAPNGTTASTNTGFFGYTTEDASLCIGTVDRFTSSGGNKWAGSTTLGQEVLCHTQGVDSQTIRVGWQSEVNGVQPPGLYSGTVILIATPTY